MDWAWDPTLYEGSARHYAVGRMAYPAALADALRDELGLDGTGRLLDVGCGPGSLTLLLAPLVASAVGVDADAGMIAEARRAEAPGIEWRQLRAEELPADLGTFRLVTFAQSFHWMDQARVARAVRADDRAGWRVGARLRDDAPGCRGRRRAPAPAPAVGRDRRARRRVPRAGPPGGSGRRCRPGRAAARRRSCATSATADRSGSRSFAGEVVERSTRGGRVRGVLAVELRTAPVRTTGCRSSTTTSVGSCDQASPGGVFAERARDVGVVIWRP